MASPSPVDALLAEARAVLGPRPGPDELPALVAAGALVVDIRPESHRRDEGVIPGAVAVERNVLEWRLDPGGDHRIGELDGPDQVVVLVCDEGYASSLAAAVLRGLGLARATDLDGGYRAWAASTEAASPSRMSDSDTSTSSKPSVR
jgi:rhodanese-related sulfurtransferase